MKYYTLPEAAAFLGKSTRTLKRWLKSGKLIPEKTGDILNGKTASQRQLWGGFVN